MSMTFSLLPTSFSRWTFGIPFHPRPLCRKSFLSRRRFVLKAETGKTSQNATSVKAMNSKASRLETETAADVKETIPFGSHGEAWLMAIAFAFCSVLFPPIQLTGLFCTIGWICCLTGTVLLINGLFTMGRNNFPFPSPRENAEFIKKGIYASVRHPQYGGCLLFCLGLCFLTRNEARVVFCAFLWMMVERMTKFEETKMKERFPDYASHCNETKKFFPKVY